MPIPAMTRYVDDVRAAIRARWPDGECYVLGHVADGNLHLFVRPNVVADLHDESDQLVYAPLREIGGSVSAEHGIGTEKLRWLPHSRSPIEIDLMRRMKKSLDPANILNPGRVLDPGR